MKKRAWCCSSVEDKPRTPTRTCVSKTSAGLRIALEDFGALPLSYAPVNSARREFEPRILRLLMGNRTRPTQQLISLLEKFCQMKSVARVLGVLTTRRQRF